MPSDTVLQKALKYFAEGRINVIHVDRDNAEALVEVQGSRKEPYKVRFTGTPGTPGWVDDCDAHIAECVHVVCALGVVDMKRPEGETTFGGDPDIDALLADS